MGQEPAEGFFGLGTELVVDQLSVRWPDGATTHHGPFAADQLVTIQRP